jgi:hypothetical protein
LVASSAGRTSAGGVLVVELALVSMRTTVPALA